MLSNSEFELLFVLPAVVLHGAVATRQFCKQSREEVRSFAQSLDSQAGLSDSWCLHPPTLHASYQRWCAKQTYIQIFPWIWFVKWALICVKLSPMYDRCMSEFWLACGLATLTLMRSVMEGRLTPWAMAMLHGVTTAFRFTSMALLLLHRNPCFLNINDPLFSSRLGMMALSVAYVHIYCSLIPVPMEYSFYTVALNVVTVFIIFTWKFLLVQTGGDWELVWENMQDWYTFLGAITSSCAGGQMYLCIRCSIGAANMRCFLKAQR